MKEARHHFTATIGSRDLNVWVGEWYPVGKFFPRMGSESTGHRLDSMGYKSGGNQLKCGDAGFVAHTTPSTTCIEGRIMSVKKSCRSETSVQLESKI
jgi:hypothetical protein